MLAQDRAAGLDRFVHVMVWRSWLEAASTERISWTGQAIGRQIGQALAQRPGLRSLHVSGTSAGGFAANECVSAYVAAAGAKRASTRLTLCDPFCARADEVGQGWAGTGRGVEGGCGASERRRLCELSGGSLAHSHRTLLPAHPPPP